MDDETPWSVDFGMVYQAGGETQEGRSRESEGPSSLGGTPWRGKIPREDRLFMPLWDHGCEHGFTGGYTPEGAFFGMNVKRGTSC